MLAANLRFNAVRQGKDVSILSGTRGTRVRTCHCCHRGPGLCWQSPRGSVWTSRGFLAAA